ncbi:hypothetical protein KK062_08190 [Fulvivirgaceae bacterium PWU5]|uniref:Uncharacterized protein n=1 Tax=Dawidia cretensis TaxID=2782350 RepID=A0AAP2DYM8_9BACT|nr:hypothetical protein [Dawidia cretensis]MBT1708199.1 hypothetical protein [Dawidia cretensis]
MKRKNGFKVLSLVTVLLWGTGTLQAQTAAQDSTGLPGDNFSLEGALEMFQKAGSPEEFEKMLNSQENNVNNLDLNEDGEADYIKVIDKRDGDVHALILQDAVSENEDQDIAVIELEKTGNDQAVLQIIGDEDIYGEERIVEPTDNTNAQKQTTRVVDDAAPRTRTHTTVVVNVWAWPAVRYMYAPRYVVWASPWAWHRRPIWWRPWRPVRYHAFYTYRRPYRPRYVVVHTHRVVHAARVYRPVRTTSVTVTTRHQASVTRYRADRTSQRKSVTVTKGNKQVKATRRTTTVEGKRGRAKTTRTTTRVRRTRD